MLKVIKEELEGICTPRKGSKYSACIDLFASEDVTIGAGETVLVPLGVKICEKLLNELAKEKIDYGDKEFLFVEWFKKSHQLNLHIRSSMSAKHGLVIANGTGIIDLDYPSEIMICLHNPIRQIRGNITIKKGDKIAQISLVEHKTYLLGVETGEERKGGFGSTGN